MKSRFCDVRAFFRTFWMVVVLLSPFLSFSQTVEEKRINLEKISAESDQATQEQAARVKEFAARKNLPIKFVDSQGNDVLMVGVTSDDKAIYIATVNAGAAITTGVDKLRTGGGLGVNLEGAGMILGIWDGGTVRTTHRELKNRVISTSGPALSDHATHVTGTMMATGINPAAKGMAPKAQIKSFHFDNDISTISTNAASMLISNHSYGLVLGWYFNSGWSWFGNTSISNVEDYQFGFYGNKTRQIDQIMVNAPYYTAVWAAGNERTDTGTSGHPADCNAGDGYDCIGVEATAKNIITVGAVNKVPAYSDPNSVQMSSFSSWGPTDDGRIKPDLVGAGVNLFSSFSGNDSAYSTISGTSMASPNVTGSLLLLQELYKNLHSGDVMRAATLKALALHTTKEAGINQGPDYRFGWGLLDAAGAAKIILDENDVDVLVSEQTLLDNQTFELAIEPKANEKITATIVWTDAPGAVVGAALDPTTANLVNDLDMRIVDDAANTQYPWILNPANPGAAATTGDNFRDNVEKIEFTNPEARSYKLRISSKRALVGGPQSFSLVLTYKSIADSRTKLYWVGGSGSWDDQAHWALTSGGSPASVIPDLATKVIFDENSFSAANSTVSLNADASCYSLTWLTKTNTNVSLNGHTLKIDADINITSSSLTVSTAGNIISSGDVGKLNTIYSNGADLSKVAYSIDEADASWTLNGTLNVESITLEAGMLNSTGATINANTISAVSTSTKSLNLSKVNVAGLKSLNLKSSNLSLNTDGSIFTLATGTPVVIDNAGAIISGRITSTAGPVTFLGDGSYKSLNLTGTIALSGNNNLDTLKIGAGSIINLASGTTQVMSANTTLAATSALPITINGGISASLNFNGHFRLCFDNLKLNNVNQVGTGVVNAGASSVLTNSAGWQNITCSDVLFADFTYQYNCVNGLAKFIDKSLGSIDSWSWDFGDAVNPQISTKQNPNHKFTAQGTFSVILTVKKGAVSKTYTQSVVVGPNALQPFDLLLNAGSLFSTGSSTIYEWYKNDDIIPGATARTYKPDGPSGVYYAVIFNATCNLPSTPFVTVSVKEELTTSAQNLVYPNPSSKGEFNVRVPSEWLPMQVNVFDMVGNQVVKQVLNETDGVIQITGGSQGMYILKLSNDRIFITQKLEIIK